MHDAVQAAVHRLMWGRGRGSVPGATGRQLRPVPRRLQGHPCGGHPQVAQPPAPGQCHPARRRHHCPVQEVRAGLGRGVGPALMQACLDAAQRGGFDLLWLDVWERNPRAIAFYHKWGFKVVGMQVFQLGSDSQTDLLMKRHILSAAV